MFLFLALLALENFTVNFAKTCRKDKGMDTLNDLDAYWRCHVPLLPGHLNFTRSNG